MYASLASSKDISLLFPSTFKHSEPKLQHKNRETMASEPHHRHPQQLLNSGSMMLRSASSSLLENYVDGSSGKGEGGGSEDLLQPHSSSPEAESMFARFMSCGGGGGGGGVGSPSPDFREIGDKSPAVSATTTRAINQRNSQFMASMEHEGEIVPQQNGFSPVSQILYQAAPPAPLLSQGSATMDNSYRMVNSMGLDHKNPPLVKAPNANLIRHSSSPAGLFSHLNVENGYGLMRGGGNFRARNATIRESAPATSRLKNQMSFSSGSPSSSALMSQISEIGSESIGANSPDDGSLGNSNGGNRCYIPSFPMGSWDDSALVSENFSGLKRVRDTNGKMLSGLIPSEIQNGEAGNRPPGLTHHLSLPKTSTEIAAMEKFLQIQDSVPCKIRAKRGCATHPRSIAERVRRTRISERMRKLQELVPNMDKQTNTADMLDLAVDYIKDLQKQVKKLTDSQANCTCSSKRKPYSSPVV